jgi:hypothetical protein
VTAGIGELVSWRVGEFVVSRSAVVAASLMAALSAPATAPSTLDDVLKRAGAYVRQFQVELQSIVAEEQYLQNEVTRAHRFAPSDRNARTV